MAKGEKIMTIKNDEKIQIFLENNESTNYDLDQVIFDLDSQLDLLTSKADNIDMLIAAGSGLLCGMLDILTVSDFDLEKSRDIASEQINSFVLKTAKVLGYEGDDLEGAVEFLEKKFPIPSDGNTPDFGGGKQHHLRDFAHHPTVVGLMFSLLTQFTHKSYGTDTKGQFLIVDVSEKNKAYIGKDIPTKIIYGTCIWLFHLVSDMAGSSSTVGKSGGTGIPGPILSLAKELSALPIFNNDKGNDISVFLSKLFNGTLLAKHDSNGKIIKDSDIRFDLRSEMGVLIELGKQAIPVITNECIVRSLYMIRRLATEIKVNEVKSIKELKKIKWEDIKPYNNPTISRMLLISTGVFTGVDLTGAAVSKKYWVAINYVGVGRFAIAIGEDMSWGLKRKNIKHIKKVYEDIKKFAYMEEDDNLYRRIGEDMKEEKFGLTVEETEILYNLEYQKIANDIQNTKTMINEEAIKSLKKDWLEEWKSYITDGFSSFINIEGATINWYTEEELVEKVENRSPEKIWFRLVLLEAMLFEPYYPLGTEEDKKGNDIPSKKYKDLKNPLNDYDDKKGIAYLGSLFKGGYYEQGYVQRLHKTYKKVTLEMKEVQKELLTGVAITAGVALATVMTAGILAPAIAVALVGTSFAGLSGAALTSACLAYLGGGAVAFGGLGMAGGTAVIVGGGAILGIIGGAGVGGTAMAFNLVGKEQTISQSAKLLVSVREIFLNDEHDLEYSDTVYEQYLEKIKEIEGTLIELRLKEDVATKEEKKELKDKIKNAEESVKVMRIARKSFLKFKSSFEEGIENN